MVFPVMNEHKEKISLRNKYVIIYINFNKRVNRHFKYKSCSDTYRIYNESFKHHPIYHKHEAEINTPYKICPVCKH